MISNALALTFHHDPRPYIIDYALYDSAQWCCHSTIKGIHYETILLCLITLWALLLASCTTTEPDTFKAPCEEIFYTYYNSANGDTCQVLKGTCALCRDTNIDKGKLKQGEDAI